MENQSNQPQDQSSDFLAKLEITVDREGIMSYNCDWDSTSDGLEATALLYYKLLFDDLPQQILDEIKKECVLNDTESNYHYVISLISKLAGEDEKGSDSGDDDVVVPPDQVYSI